MWKYGHETQRGMKERTDGVRSVPVWHVIANAWRCWRRTIQWRVRARGTRVEEVVQAESILTNVEERDSERKWRSDPRKHGRRDDG